MLSYLIRYDPYLILSYLWWAVFAQNNTEVIPMSDNGFTKHTESLAFASESLCEAIRAYPMEHPGERMDHDFRKLNLLIHIKSLTLVLSGGK